MTERWTSPCGRMELRLGDYREVLADVEADHCITDPPYSERTHGGQRHGRSEWRGGSERWATTRGLGYSHWSPDDVAECVRTLGPRVRGWWAVWSDHGLQAAWEGRLQESGQYVFAPVPCVLKGMNIRLAGDGPSSWAVYLTVGRPRTREFQRWRTLPGAYIGNPFDKGENTATASRRTSVVGSKPLWLARAIVRDYSRPGDLIVDPCAGGGTTLLAAAIEGRRAIGAEIDPETYHKAVERLSRGYTPVVQFDELSGTQEALL